MIHATLCILLKIGKAFIERLLYVECHTNADKYRYLYVGEGIWEKRGSGELWNLYCPEKPFSCAYRKERKAALRTRVHLPTSTLNSVFCCFVFKYLPPETALAQPTAEKHSFSLCDDAVTVDLSRTGKACCFGVKAACFWGGEAAASHSPWDSSPPAPLTASSSQLTPSPRTRRAAQGGPRSAA